MGYLDIIRRGENYTEEEIHDVCVNIVTETHDYNLAFIEFETQDLLGVRVTRHDFSEGLVILNKKYIVSVTMVYEGDIIISTDEDKDPSYI